MAQKACSAVALPPRVTQAGTGVGPPPAFTVHAPIALGGGFFGGAALALGFDFDFGLGAGAGVLFGFFARGVSFWSGAEQAQSNAGAQHGAEQGVACGWGSGGGVVHGGRKKWWLYRAMHAAAWACA